MATETIPSADASNSAVRPYNPARDIGRATEELTTVARNANLDELTQDQAHQILMSIAHARDLLRRAVGAFNTDGGINPDDQLCQYLEEIRASADLLANDCDHETLLPGTLDTISARILNDTQQAMEIAKSRLALQRAATARVSSVHPVPN